VLKNSIINVRNKLYGCVLNFRGSYVLHFMGHEVHKEAQRSQRKTGEPFTCCSLSVTIILCIPYCSHAMLGKEKKFTI